MITYAGVSKIFGEGPDAVTALDNVSFEVADGEVVVFLGPSGCGKTTTLRLTNRLESITRGRILVNQRDIMEFNPVKLRQSMGYVIQDIGLFPNQTIAQNVAVVPRMLGWSKDRIRDVVHELLTMVNLDPDIFGNRYPAELSGGQQQRVGVARGLAADPKILLMDEPFGAIDPINRDQIQDEFLRLQEKLKKTIVFVSHDIHEAIKMGDKIAIFNEGRLVQYDTPEAILTQPCNQFVADFVGSDRALKVLGLMRVRDAMNRQPRNVVHADQPAADTLRWMEEKKLTYAIVLQGGKPLGYVSPRQLKYELGPVREVVKAYPTYLEEANPLRDALAEMLMNDFSLLCVVDQQGNFSGTLSYPNIQKALAHIYDEADEPEERRRR
jgi:osmoprotectant transport system ATP-binding protein